MNSLLFLFVRLCQQHPSVGVVPVFFQMLAQKAGELSRIRLRLNERCSVSFDSDVIQVFSQASFDEFIDNFVQFQFRQHFDVRSPLTRVVADIVLEPI